MIICIGPFCIPVVWGLPFFAAVFMYIKNWFLSFTYSAPKAVLPEKSADENVLVVATRGAFDKAVASGDLVLLYFTASWCGPCKKIYPYLADLSSRYVQISFIKVDVDELEEAAAEYRINAMPTFVLLHKGKEVERLQGADEVSLVALCSKGRDMDILKND